MSVRKWISSQSTVLLFDAFRLVKSTLCEAPEFSEKRDLVGPNDRVNGWARWQIEKDHFVEPESFQISDEVL